ncbi:Hypothetical predicted protein [Podarcis lilfordi]|uniref:Uncharacterized protein n=1 Tax=Podarcis lilfordi TaxID=74358 RepID=A0AA35LJB8_9SAUR|nr:Hypothetical predicted protein [Podarcis lilfordi]
MMGPAFQKIQMSPTRAMSPNTLKNIFLTRKHIKKLRAGKKCYFLTESESETVPSTQCVLALGRFTAYQIAYIIWGYVIMHLMQFVAGMILVYVIILPMVHGEWAKLLDKWGTVILSFVLVMLLRRLELFAGSRVFLQPKISPKDDQRPLALDNRKAFVNFSYFLFFHSVVVGLFSCLMRVLRSTVLGAFLIGRLDRPVMPKGFEGCDKAHTSWVAMLLMDHYHSNPILVCFCHILDTKIRQRQWQKVNGPTENTDMREIALCCPSRRSFDRPIGALGSSCLICGLYVDCRDAVPDGATTKAAQVILAESCIY